MSNAAVREEALQLIDKLPVAERIALVQAIWDRLAAVVESSPLTEGQRQEVDRRLAAHRANPQAAIPWEQVETEALARLYQRKNMSRDSVHAGQEHLS